MGGLDAKDRPLNNVAIYDTVTDDWFKSEKNLLQPRYNCTAFVQKSRYVYLMPLNYSLKIDYLDTGLSSEFNTNNLKSVMDGIAIAE